MTDAIIGYGSSFQYGDGASPEVFTSMGEVKGITAPSTEVDILDATHMASPSKFREFVQGLADGGEMQIRMNYVPGSPTDLAIQARQPGGASEGSNNYQINLPAAGAFAAQTLSMSGIVSGYERDIENEGVIEAVVTVKVTGAVAQAATA